MNHEDCQLAVQTNVTPGSKDSMKLIPTSRWNYVAAQTAELAAEASKVNKDGFYAAIFDTTLHPIVNANGLTVAAACRSFRPYTGTNTADALNSRIEAYFARRDADPKTKPLVIVMLTDGEPTGTTVKGVSTDPQQAVADVIVNASKRIKSRKELGILFIQVGFDGKAKIFLQWLDDGLTAAGAVLDIVDTKTADDARTMTILEMIDSALND